jgi:GH15 family glucan-1,4-alpha-glucosidase
MVKRIITETHTPLRDASIRIIKANQAGSGAYIASPNFRVYDYSWFRDGAFIAEAMSVSGENESALDFHKWATRVIIEREEKIASLIRRGMQGEKIANDEHLHCRYTVEGKESSEQWTNLQLDGFGTWIWSLDKFIERGNVLPLATYRAVETLIGYLGTFWKIDTYDWWEESYGHQHVANLGSIAAGLERSSKWIHISDASRKSAADTAKEIMELIRDRGVFDGRLAKWIDGNGLDASLIALVAPFELLTSKGSDENVAKTTIEAVASELGMFGTYRHRDDWYFGGGKWPLLSCFLGLGYISLGESEKAQAILDWVATLTNEVLELPEQLEEPLLQPDKRAQWIEQWGEPAVPLLWSHAMYLSLYSALRKD